MANDKFQCIIKKLKCNRNEDDVGKDECRLSILPEGIPVNGFCGIKAMDEGDEWNLNKAFDFYKGILVTLTDEDLDATPDSGEEWAATFATAGHYNIVAAADKDDFLGSVKIPAEEKLNGVGKFSRHGANYDLYYDVRKYEYCEKHDKYYGIHENHCQECAWEQGQQPGGPSASRRGHGQIPRKHKSAPRVNPNITRNAPIRSLRTSTTRSGTKKISTRVKTKKTPIKTDNIKHHARGIKRKR
jgi:hypothetical protein